MLDVCTMYIFINSVLKCWTINNIYVDHMFFSCPERGQGARHVPAHGPFAVHRVVFEMPASRGRTENPVGRPSQSPVRYRYTQGIFPYGLRLLLVHPPKGRVWVKLIYSILWAAILQCKHWLPYSPILFRQSVRCTQHSQNHRSGNHRSAERIAQIPGKTSSYT